MPTYGYRCTQCGHELEVFQSMSDEPLRVCPDCSGQLKKLLYPVGVHFKGSGFYSTDYKNGGSPGSKKNGSGESSSGSESSGESSKSSSDSTKKTETTAAAKE